MLCVLAVVQGKNEKRSKASEAKAAHQSAEAARILVDGGNPYEVFRKRDIEADTAKQVLHCVLS